MTKPPVFLLRGDSITDLSFHSEDLLLSSHANGEVSIWDLKERAQISTAGFCELGLVSVSTFHKDKILVQGRDGVLQIADIGGGRSIRTDSIWQGSLDCTTFAKAIILPEGDGDDSANFKLAAPVKDGECVGNF